MNRQKTGKILIWNGALGFLIFVVLTLIQGPTQRTHTAEELAGTMHGIWGALWMIRLMGIGLGMMLPVIGVLLATSEKGSRVWLMGLMPMMVIEVGVLWQPPYMPPLLGLGGVIIAASYIGILWTWTQRFTASEGLTRTGKQVQLVGYTVLVATALLLCMAFGNPNILALANEPVPGAQSINSSLAIGMLLLFVGNYLEAKDSEEAPESQLAKLRPQLGGGQDFEPLQPAA